MKNRHHKNLIIFLSIGIIYTLLITSTLTTSGLQLAGAKGHQQMETMSKDKILQTEHNEETNEITHDKIISLTDQFMEILLQDIDENYKVENYDTMDELLNAFDQVAARETAEPYVHFYYTEESDGLYILPTETPPWFTKDNPYNVIQLDNNKAKVVQDNHSVFYDNYTIEIEFTFDTQWKITNINLL
ncbi:hypothetical protein [Virgibacillus ainsalahensis]